MAIAFASCNKEDAVEVGLEAEKVEASEGVQFLENEDGTFRRVG